MAKDVYIANLNPGVVRNEFMATLIELLMYDLNHDARIAMFVPRMAGGCLGIYRNMAVQHFLDTCEQNDALEYMLFLDSDIQLTPDTLDKLLAHNEPIVAGLYFMPLEGGIYPSIFDFTQTHDDNLYHMVPRRYYEPGSVISCGGTGAGCLLIHKDVFSKLKEEYGAPMPWFAESAHNGVAFGEDFTFCMRATAAGFQILVDTDAEVGHVKNTILTHENATQRDMTGSA